MAGFNKFIAVLLSLTAMTGCYRFHTTFQYECNPHVIEPPRTNSPSLSVQVSDARTATNKKLLADYYVAMYHYQILSKQDIAQSVQDAVSKELVCRGHRIDDASSLVLSISINDICTCPLFTWSFSDCNNYGLITADIEILHEGRSVLHTPLHTTIKSSKDGGGGVDPRLLANPLLYEFVQDLLSNREISGALCSTVSSN